MNVYDFDKTIYGSDSTVDFYLFCLKRYPRIISCLPKQIWNILKYKIHLCTKEQMKAAFFCFLTKIDKVDCEIDLFVEKHVYKIKKWYLDISEETDVVVSASPLFLLDKFSKETTGFKVIASNVDKKTGKFSGKNCYGEEKVRRFREEFPNERINCFYSDSLSDRPLARLSEKAYLVKKDSFTAFKMDE